MKVHGYVYPQIDGLICKDCRKQIPNARSPRKLLCDDCSYKRRRKATKQYELKKKKG